MSSSTEKFVSLRQAATRLGVHHATLSRAVKRGEIVPEFVTPGGFMRFSSDEVERYYEQRLKYRGKKAPISAVTGLDITNSDVMGRSVPGQALESIPHLARQMVDAEYAALAVMNQNGEVVRFIVSGVSEEEAKRIGDPPVGKGLLGALHSEGKPIRIPDISKDARSVGFPPGHPPMKGLLGVPIILNGVSLGNLYLTNKRGAAEFTEHDQEIVEAFAMYAAAAIENTRLYDRESDLRQRAEQERAQLLAILESSPAAVVVANADDGRVIVSNKETFRILGRELNSGDSKETYEEAATYRRPDGSVFDRDDLPLRRALNGGHVSRGVEVIFDLPDGRQIPTIVNAAPVYGEDGKVAAAIAVFEDISALREVDRVKSEFLSMISHDLRGPLSTIKGLSSSLMMNQGPRDLDTILEYVNSIDEEADRMAELVSNLLDMSRIEAKAMPMDPEICHLADIAAECVRQVERSRTGGLHQISVDVPLELPEIFADYDQISRVLSNLFSNAMKYSPQGSEIRVRSYLDPEQESLIITEVRDEGLGIPEDEIDKIFDKFYRVTTQGGRGRPGSGLGLAICKSIIEAHDGKIWVESQAGKGSSFYFSLPAATGSVGI